MTNSTSIKTPGVPTKVGVLGGGRMGAGIAHAFLVSGAEVTVVERDTAAAAAARDRVTGTLAKAIERAAVTEDLGSLLGRFAISTDAMDFGGAGLVVEAVPEDFTLKQEALLNVERSLGADAWIATNTSSLSVTRLAAPLSRPERLCGLHFFNPVPASTLVEVVLGPQSAPELADAATGWVRGLGKTPIVVHDAPGFASSRLGVALALEAMRMLEEGVASAQDIDAAMELGYRHASGPLRTTDIVGLDVRLGIAEYLHETLGERFAPPRILRDMVARGELGRKSGKGFYDYS
ncbi:MULTISPECIES: 3-hydroxyacyl-CoA dehydrogenase family protein [Micrococcaceae]|jgi:3-hydroxybutyryl-CoA dehydrogenase|uniref:3-hydroxyacyl-CoA dehydrogenase family protein n=1 Tax=Micrococcaceae TaxID=1268 RepID=UPI002098649F|nr:3-hydroxyacyl-CoA dehydrogenase family protein [Arthrobacter sp. H16F315]MDD1478743.1 3-hydroxyacyl-CoA dehydrogenase family protein [Arthrobacter sp. H16F315]MDD1478790.1 3-hydroxyacyl-CoA dehydrogenase family protein [Arthrobacter sp. H16F315]